MLVTNGNKNNWSQTSPCRRINSRGEKVKGWTQGIDEHSCETLQCLNVYVYECIKSVEIELMNENGCLNWNLRNNMNKRDFLFKKHYLDSCFSNYKNFSMKTNPSDSNKESWELCSRCIRNKNVNSDANNKEPSNHVACHSTACHSPFNFFTCVNDSVPHD